MSKERKLLEKVAVQLLVFDLKKASDLVDEIQELLAQPEEEEDEYISEESGYNRSDWWGN